MKSNRNHTHLRLQYGQNKKDNAPPIATVKCILGTNPQDTLHNHHMELTCTSASTSTSVSTYASTSASASTAAAEPTSTTPHIYIRACAPSGRSHRNRRCPSCVFERLLCPESSAPPCFTASCCRDGSLAVIQPFWVQKTSEVPSMFEGAATAHTCAHPTSNACTSLERHCNATHPSRSSPHGSVRPHFADIVHASVRASGIEKEESCPPACATSPMLVGRDRSFRNWSVHQDKNQRSVGPYGSAGFNGSTSSCPNSGREIQFRLPCSSKNVQDCNRHFGTQRHDRVPNASQWSQHRSCARFQNSARNAKRCQWTSFSSVAR